MLHVHQLQMATAAALKTCAVYSKQFSSCAAPLMLSCVWRRLLLLCAVHLCM